MKRHQLSFVAAFFIHVILASFGFTCLHSFICFSPLNLWSFINCLSLSHTRSLSPHSLTHPHTLTHTQPHPYTHSPSLTNAHLHPHYRFTTHFFFRLLLKALNLYLSSQFSSYSPTGSFPQSFFLSAAHTCTNFWATLELTRSFNKTTTLIF